MAKHSNQHLPIRSPVECVIEGKVYQGTYYVERGSLTVEGMGGITHASPGARPDAIAQIMLRELVEDARRRGQI